MPSNSIKPVSIAIGETVWYLATVLSWHSMPSLLWIKNKNQSHSYGHSALYTRCQRVDLHQSGFRAFIQPNSRAWLQENRIHFEPSQSFREQRLLTKPFHACYYVSTRKRHVSETAVHYCVCTGQLQMCGNSNNSENGDNHKAVNTSNMQKSSCQCAENRVGSFLIKFQILKCKFQTPILPKSFFKVVIFLLSSNASIPVEI